MARNPRIAVMAAAAVALTTLGSPVAYGTPAEHAVGLRPAADTSHVVDLRPRPRPDAGVIAYVSDRDTPADATEFIDEIYLLDPQTRAVQRLTYDVPGVERWPTIAPDGRSLAWVRFVFDDSGPRQDLERDFPL